MIELSKLELKRLVELNDSGEETTFADRLLQDKGLVVIEQFEDEENEEVFYYTNITEEGERILPEIIENEMKNYQRLTDRKGNQLKMGSKVKYYCDYYGTGDGEIVGIDIWYHSNSATMTFFHNGKQDCINITGDNLELISK